ncbi:choice-of-anchor W domain-containing protein [Argonema antarcticum]|uniref:choice-of-anchor W domain-containing protein n=1 Tax=Argonema antarcticum TaxID=2942763 RepID=UPI002010E60B|nr:choice-of-anchor W domain-containing protein [Argonema antarcticum]MCL1472766.1 PEP-CTERM sorting domain-containing protein [Argonema antarcticum A004/B2]
MSHIRKALFALAAVGLGTLSVPTAANAFNLVDRTGFTDTQFNQMRTDGLFTELFVAESRIGNNSTSTAERELGINTDTGAPVAIGDRTWGNGGLVDFVLEYTGSLVKYTVGGQLLSSTAFSGLATDIFLRTRAADKSTMTMSDLVFNGVGISSLSSSGVGGNSDVDYLQLSGISTPFTLTGKSMMSWTGTQPMRSNLAYQIKVGTTPQTQSVPEPGTVGAIALTGLLALGSKKQQKAVKE